MRRYRVVEILPGAIIGVLLWGIASWGLGLYLKLFAHYSFICGTLATIVVFLI